MQAMTDEYYVQGMAASGTSRDSAGERGSGGQVDDKKRKKLELNRIASRESRKRKKRRLEELQRSVLFLTHENHQLREQNELLRQMLIGRLPGVGLNAPPGANGAIGDPATAVTLPPQFPPPSSMGADLTGVQSAEDGMSFGVGEGTSKLQTDDDDDDDTIEDDEEEQNIKPPPRVPALDQPTM